MTIQPFKEEGGLWKLRNVVTGEVLERGPFIEAKTANRAAKRLNEGEANPFDGAPLSPTAPEPKAQPEPEVSPEPAPEPKAQPEPVEPGFASGKRRQEWLDKARVECTAILAQHGGEVPAEVRISFGFCSTGRKSKRIGECWSAEASTDGAREMFIVPTLTDTGVILATVLHELVHAALPPTAKHGPLFKKLATAAGLEGKMTATVAGEALKAHFAEWVAEHGPCPAGALRSGVRLEPKQSTRMLKAACEACGYTVRLSKKWLEVATPVCPDEACDNAGLPMVCD